MPSDSADEVTVCVANTAPPASSSSTTSPARRSEQSEVPVAQVSDVDPHVASVRDTRITEEINAGAANGSVTQE